MQVITKLRAPHIGKVLIAFLALGVFYFSNVYGQNKSIDSLQIVLKNYDAEDTHKVNLLADLSYRYHVINSDSTYIIAQRGLSLAEKLNFVRGKLRNLNNIGSSYLIQGNYFLATQAYLKALDISENKKQEIDRSTILNNLGWLAYLQEDYTKAQTTFLAGLKEAKLKKNAYMNLSIHLNLGHLYKAKQEYELSINYLNKALNFGKRIKNAPKGYLPEVYSQLIANYRKLNQYNRAVILIENSTKLMDDEENKFANSFLKYEIAYIYFETKRYKKSLEYAKEAFSDAKELENKDIYYQSAYILSEIYQQTNQLDSALYYYQVGSIAKDSLFSNNVTRQIANIQSKFELEGKQKEIALLEKDKMLQTEETKNQKIISYSLIGGVLLTLLLSLNFYQGRQKQKAANDMLQIKNEEIATQSEELMQTNDALHLAYRQIETKNADITSSINAAKLIQDAILPSEKAIANAVSDFFIFYQPRDIVSGDFYYYTQKNGKFIITAVDCTGHGVPGAFMSMLSNQVLNEVIEQKNITEASKILHELNIIIGQSLHKEETTSHAGMDLALCVIDKKNKLLEYAGAMNPLYYVQDGEFKEIKADKQAIGGMESKLDKTFTPHYISLSSPATFYLCSDGFQDQFGGEQGKKFMVKKLKELLFSIHHLPMKEQKEILTNTLEKWKNKHEQVDDILIIGFQV